MDLINRVIPKINKVRENHPGCGLAKLYRKIKPEGMGRDRFVELFLELGFGVVRKANKKRTTRAGKIRFPNLIEGMLLDGPNQLWQSDITYKRIGKKFCYLVFIIDAYTKKIVGHIVSNSLRKEANIKALKMAFKNSPDNLKGLVHHSDRGSQYSSKQYVKLLKDKGIEVSMGETALDNAYAERINGTIKNEYLKYWDIETLEKLRARVKRAVNNYNNERLHDHLPGDHTPVSFEKEYVNYSDRDRPKVIVYAEGKKDKSPGASSPGGFRPRTGPPAHVCPI